MTKWITSDLHFGHKNIMKFCPETRGRYSGVDDMDLSMLEEWNSIVTPQDTVYILGDISFRDLKTTMEIVYCLNGSKHLIIGNHDHKLIRHQEFLDAFHSVNHYADYHDSDHKVQVVMFHYPILEWNGCHYGSVHFHGHTHGGKTGLEGFRAMDVGYDSTGKLLSNYDELITEAKTKPHYKRTY